MSCIAIGIDQPAAFTLVGGLMIVICLLFIRR